MSMNSRWITGDKRLLFGKWKGRGISTVPTDYLEWLAAQPTGKVPGNGAVGHAQILKEVCQELFERRSKKRKE